jgi:16S rRNA (uracil1498-N3)-methyltransferase
VRHLLHPLPGELVHITAETQVRHRLKRVLRLDDGAPLVLCDGAHRTQPVTWHGDRFEPAGPVELHPGLAPELHLAAGVLKGERQDWLVEKAAELGVDVFVPLLLDHGVVRVQDRADKQARWQAIADGALEQCGRTWRMQVALPTTLEAWLPGPQAYFADETGGASWQTITAQSRVGALRIAVGPEGGWSAHERNLFSTFKVIGVTIGPLVLRAETAGLTVAAIARSQA